MKLKLTKLFAVILCLFGLSPIFAPELVFAEDKTSSVTNVCDSSASDTIKAAAGCPSVSSSDNDLPTVIQLILNSIISVIGVVAVVFVVIGGIGYTTSAGDAGKLKKSKDTIIYACIGIVICVLSFAIVNWVILGVLKQGSSTEEESEEADSEDVALVIEYSPPRLN